MGRTGEQVELYITDISTQGEGIGKSGGLAVFASGALPGDTVLAEITEDKGRFAKAKVLEILKASPDRGKMRRLRIAGAVLRGGSLLERELCARCAAAYRRIRGTARKAHPGHGSSV